MFNLKEFFVSKWTYLKWVLLTLFVIGVGVVMFSNKQTNVTKTIVSEAVSVANSIQTSPMSVSVTATESSTNVESKTDNDVVVTETLKENVSTEPKTENVGNTATVQDKTPSNPRVVETQSTTVSVQTTQLHNKQQNRL